MTGQEKSETNVWWYIILTFLLVLFVSAIQIYTASLLENPNANVNDLEYIFAINNIDLSEFNTTVEEIEKGESNPTGNETGSQSKDFALEFFYARAQASKIENVVKNVFRFPEFVVILLKIPYGAVSWIINILNWFWRFALLVAIIYFIRGIK